jgi:hypothetical protein
VAQQTTVRFIDDLDGSEASGTFDLSLDGRDYQIDLSDENAAKLRDALSPFLAAARKAGGRGVQPCSWPASAGCGQAHPFEPRGDPRDPRVGSSKRAPDERRGRIPKSVIDAYQTAH